MCRKIDIKEIKAYLFEDTARVEKLLEYFDFHGFNYTSDALRCAVPDGDNVSSVALYLTENLYGIVYTRGSFKGDIFHIIQHISERELSEILTITRSLFGLSGDKNFIPSKRFNLVKDMAKYRKRGVVDQDNKLFDESALNGMVMLPHVDIIQEGVSPQVCKQFNVCYDPKDDRIIFPHYSWNHPDMIVGLQGRKVGMTNEDLSLLGIPKYINKIKGYRKSENLYGWNLAHENILKNKQIILFEGEKSVLKEFTLNRGDGISVALGGHYISDTHIKIIARHTPLDTEVVLAFDRDVMDDPDELESVMAQARKLSLFRKVTYIQDMFPVGRLLGEKDSPIDKGPKIWRYLLETRKKVK